LHQFHPAPTTTAHLHLSLVALAHLVALEAVLIPAGLLAQLAVPAQLVQALGLNAVGNLHEEQASNKCQMSVDV
jgi:hypothetical protein